MTTINISDTERARQDGYDSGYEDGVASVRQSRADGAVLLSVSDVVELYPLDALKLDRWRHDGIGPINYRLADHAVYPSDELEAWCKRVGIPPRAADPPALADGPIDCAPWCKYADGHPGMFREDQRCYSDELRIDLSTHQRIELSVADETGAWAPGPDYVTVFAKREADGGTVLCVSRADEDEANYTPAEAGQLVEALQLLLGQIGAKPTREDGDVCACGKPASHVNADEDSAEWACRVPTGDRS